KAGATEVYASAGISWGSNTWRQIGVEWTSGDSGDVEIYLDGALAAANYDSGVDFVPARSTWTNGFFIGSDNTGYEQACGAFWMMYTWTEECGGYYTDGWPYLSNAIAVWQGTQAGSNLGTRMGMGTGG